MDPDIWSELLVIRDRLKNSIEQQQLLVNRLQHLQDVVAATQREDTGLAEANTTIDVLRRQCHTVCGWKGRCEKAEQELAEAKETIKRRGYHD